MIKVETPKLWKLRSEIKYFVPTAIVPLLSRDLQIFAPLDNYSQKGKYYVESIYFDDPHLNSFYDKVEGVGRRTKFRVRSYTPHASQTRPLLNLESKRRCGEKYLKAKASLSFEDFETIVKRQSLRIKPDSLSEEFYIYVMAKQYRPNVNIAYERLGFLNPMGDLRATIDTNISAARFWKLGSADHFVPVLNPHTSVLEFKFPELAPHWMENIVRKYALNRTKISKYEIAVRRLIDP